MKRKKTFGHCLQEIQTPSLDMMKFFFASTRQTMFNDYMYVFVFTASLPKVVLSQIFATTVEKSCYQSQMQGA